MKKFNLLKNDNTSIKKEIKTLSLMKKYKRINTDMEKMLTLCSMLEYKKRK